MGKLTCEEAQHLRRPVHMEEIIQAIQAGNPNKAPGPDGFNAHFFKLCWSIVGYDVSAAISDFFLARKTAQADQKH